MRARVTNASTSGDAVEATIAESGKVVVESVPYKRRRGAREDVRFGNVVSHVAGFTAVGGNKDAGPGLVGVF